MIVCHAANPGMGHKYDYAIDVADDSAPARVVRMVGEGKRVLEIGAGRGSMTRVLSQSLDCSVTALEIDGDSIQVLTPLCERVIQIDLNDPLWTQTLQTEKGFDVVVEATDAPEPAMEYTSVFRVAGAEICVG